MNDMAISHHGCVLLVVTALSAIALCGFFITKTSGFGRYNTSVLVVILAISFGCIALISGFLPGQAFSGLLMAVVGFAGGMVVGKEQS
ncbi:hypothetical protein [Thermomonas sp.]|uniref:hypothetical protein n=1 Tax=Thermomonas sp. TaxID=1971895 RepID=UPI0026082D62|nr:hypothetical protein [Thermomonas sp.]